MDTYIALLRGINVAGQKKMPMAEVRKMMVDLGFKEVQTYIQSGNIIFKSTSDTVRKLEKSIHTAIDKAFGFDVPVLVKSVAEIKSIVVQNPFDDKEDLEKNRIYFVLLQEPANPELVIAFKKIEYPNEKYVVSDNCVYLCCKNGYGKAKLNNNLIERKLKVKATTRNYKTMNTLIELSGMK